jgi:pimeloyl-ACP methyl ester carboxylesterase
MEAHSSETTMLRLERGALEVLDLEGKDPTAPLILLHEGLGSVGLWRGFPERLHQATGARTIAFSRHGHGQSDLPGRPRQIDFIYDEAAEVLPQVLSELGAERPLLVGHSDGATIALVYAADHRPRGVVALAPHVIVEDRTIAGIEVARENFESGDLATRMAQHHRDPDATFSGWCDVWLDPDFRRFDIRDRLPRVEAPLLLIQGADDSYGTIHQLDEIERLAAGPTRRLVVDGDHWPHLENGDEVVATIAGFARDLPR